MDRGIAEDDTLDSRLARALKQDAYSHPLALDADTVRLRLARLGTHTTLRWLLLAASMVGGAAVVIAALNLGPDTSNLGGNGDSSVPLFARATPGPGLIAPLALAVGILDQDENGCLVIRREAGLGHGQVLIWPSPGTTWDGARRTLTVDGVSVHLGSRIEATGGAAGPPRPENDVWVNPPKPECQRDEYFLVYRLMSD